MNVVGDSHRAVLETRSGWISIHVVHSKRSHFVDKMVLHLRSSNIDGKSSRFMNIDVVIVNAIMIRIPFMEHSTMISPLALGLNILQSKGGSSDRASVSP